LAPILIALALGVFGYLWWKYRFTTLTRNCRWRQDRRVGGWHCVYCGGRIADAADDAPPRRCVHSR